MEANNRGEALVLHAANAKGEHFGFSAQIERKKVRYWKVRSLGPTIVDAASFPFLLYPFFLEWNCVDTAKLEEALKGIEDLGIETPYVAEPESSK